MYTSNLKLLDLILQYSMDRFHKTVTFGTFSLGAYLTEDEENLILFDNSGTWSVSTSTLETSLKQLDAYGCSLQTIHNAIHKALLAKGITFVSSYRKVHSYKLGDTTFTIDYTFSGLISKTVPVSVHKSLQDILVANPLPSLPACLKPKSTVATPVTEDVPY
jgi:hypothetical protein